MRTSPILSRAGRLFAMADAEESRSFAGAQLARAIVVLAVVIIGLLSLLALGGWRVAAYVAGWSDLSSYHLPKYQYVAERLAQGSLPLWNPWEFGGIPFLASLQPGVFYPPVPFFYSLWSGESAHVAFFFFHLAVAALGTLLLMRSFGRGPWASVLASLWVTQPLWLVRIYDHPNFIATVCWIPWLILFLRRCLQAPSVRAATGLATCAALQFLAGYPPATFATVYVLLIGVPFWLLEGAARDQRGAIATSVPRRMIALVVAGGVCVLLVAAQLLPTAELALMTNRQNEAAAKQEALRGLGAAGSHGLFLVGIPQMTVGAAVEEFWSTFGPVLIVLALLALLVGRRGAPVWFLLAAVVLSGLLPYPAYGKLPLYGHVRWALEWHLIAPMMVFMLAGCGLDALLARGVVRPRHAAAWALAIAVLSVGWNWRLIDARWLRPQATEPLTVPDWATRHCRLDDQRFRAYWPQGQFRGSLFAARVRSIGGYDQSLLPARTARLVDTLGIGNGAPLPRWAMSTSIHRKMVARMALRCMITPFAPILERGEFLPYVPFGRELQVYTNPNAQPRARLARDARFAASPDEALARLRADQGRVVLETAPEELPGGTCDDPASSASIVRDEPEVVGIATQSACAAYLVLADTNLRGWSATVDGADVPIVTADYAFRAVRVPAGAHEVVFRYAPWTVPAGLVLSVVGLAVAAVLVLLPRRYDPLRGAPSGPFTRSSS